ncbi:hypothetical protein ABPG74_010315 [Tetrahymena malaccensis]
MEGNKITIQVLNDNLNILSQHIDEINKQIQQIRLDDQYNKETENTILRHLQKLCQKIQQVSDSGQNVQDQEFRNKEAINNIKKELTFNKNYNSKQQGIIETVQIDGETKSLDENKKTTDDFEIFDLNISELDFQRIKRFEYVQNLIEKEKNYLNYDEKFFFSDYVIKLSSSGKSKQMIICVTQNYFYVLPETIKEKDSKSFFIKDINEIILAHDDEQNCSLIIKNEFKLNLQICHRQELVKYIFTVIKNLNTPLPKMNFKQSQFCLIPKNINNNLLSQCTSQSLSDKQEVFKIIIYKNDDNQINNSNKTHGFLQIENQKVILLNSNFEKFEVQLIKKDALIKNLMFQSLNQPSQLFKIQLQNDYDFPLLVNKLDFFKIN